MFSRCFLTVVLAINLAATLSDAAGAQGIMSSILPTARSVQTGTPAGVFASVINSSAVTVEQCTVAFAANTPEAAGTLRFQQVDESGDPVAGSLDIPFEIGASFHNGYYSRFYLRRRREWQPHIGEVHSWREHTVAVGLGHTGTGHYCRGSDPEWPRIGAIARGAEF